MLSADALALLPGQPVVGRDGESAGKVLDVYTLPSERISFASVSSLALGMRASLVPLADATLEGSTLRLPFTKEEMRGAPRFEVDGELAPAEAEELLTYYRSLGGAGTDAAEPATLTVVVTSSGGETPLSGAELDAVSDQVSEVVEQLVEQTQTEPGSTATASIELVGDEG